ncbi:hypothetical protein [Zoogloea sp.]|uniref:hypothetical protein n=1 Tax=Zoogloea sp. TaxID=49181 RepID=UPI0035B09EF2
MKNLVSALSALTLLAAPLPALAATAGETAPQKTEAAPTAAGDTAALPAPPKVTRWEDTGMKPAEAREWQNYGFSPHDGMNWHTAGFEPVVARTWSDKGFDADEARAWRDSARQSRSMMAELDHSDPAAWKREGFSPADRLAWWDAGFVFDDAVLLARSGMTPNQAAWHGHEKLKELRSSGASVAPDAAKTASPAAPAAIQAPSPAAIWTIVGPFLKVGLVALVVFLSAGFAFFIYRRAQANSKLATLKPSAADSAPDSELPPESEPPAKLGRKVLEKRKPARAVKLFKSASPHCIHCKSSNVRRSKMHPHKFAGINFTEYFRCKNCGRHFAIVSYTSILAAGGAVVLALLLITASFIYVFSIA